jgi:hypothetical protein
LRNDFDGNEPFAGARIEIKNMKKRRQDLAMEKKIKMTLVWVLVFLIVGVAAVNLIMVPLQIFVSFSDSADSYYERIHHVTEDYKGYFAAGLCLIAALLGIWGKLPGTKSSSEDACLSKTSKAVLARHFLQTKEQKASIFLFYKQNFKRWLIMLLCSGVLLTVFYLGQEMNVFFFLVGFLVSFMLWCFMVSLRLQKNWLFYEEVVDWGKVETMAKEKTDSEKSSGEQQKDQVQR